KQINLFFSILLVLINTPRKQ
ncbi:hypothetical protein Zm00014a_026690, partial [Zea mays]